ncbi:MAG: FRG domain-containing protein, partial [Burkholderiales bacterium]
MIRSVESRLFWELPEPKTLEQVLSLFSFIRMNADVREWIWRGQADYRWRLDSAATRRLRAGLKTAYWGSVESHVREYDRELLNEARLAGHAIAMGHDLSDLELMALLQHHGAATRLLDFTTNLLVALWFASCELPSVSGIVIGIAGTRRLS